MVHVVLQNCIYVTGYKFKLVNCLHNGVNSDTTLVIVGGKRKKFLCNIVIDVIGTTCYLKNLFVKWKVSCIL